VCAPQRLPPLKSAKPAGGRSRRTKGRSASPAQSSVRSMSMDASGFDDDEDDSGLQFDSSIFTKGIAGIEEGAGGGDDADVSGRMDPSFFVSMHAATKKGSKWMTDQDRR
jgi:hypothetical protein